MIDEFLQDLKDKAPSLIVDSSSETSSVPPIDRVSREAWISKNQTKPLLPEMNEVFRYISANYRSVATVGPDRWEVFELIEN